MNPFRIAGLDPAPFVWLYAMSDPDLQRHGAIRQFADESPGFPCRVSLVDAEVGEELLLLPFVHQSTSSPYRASGPIFVRRDASRRVLDVGEVPLYVTRRQMSIRAYDAHDMMIAATVCEGPETAPAIDRLLDDEQVAYLHLHNAKRGCFSCRVNRA